jgi:hypothetical protein
VRKYENCFTTPSRKLCIYPINDGPNISVLWHSGSDMPPNEEDTQRLQAILDRREF